MHADRSVPDLDALEVLARGDRDLAHRTAGEWLARADQTDDVLRLRLLLVRADAESRRGENEPSVRTIREVLAWADEHDHRPLQARSHRLLASTFMRVGDPSIALEHAILAVDLLDAASRLVIRAEHMLTLADALCECGSLAEGHRRYEDAQQLAIEAGDVDLRLIVLNNLAFTQVELEDAPGAVEAAEKLVAVSAAHGAALGMSNRDTVARAYMLAGRLAEAEQVLTPAAVEELCRNAGHEREYYGVANALLTLAEVQRLLAKVADAQDTLDACRRLCADRPMAKIAVQVQREQAELLAAQGRYREAFELHKTYHLEMLAFSSVEKEARARTLQAIFEAGEARRDSERFRELAVRDSLTGLHNRRYADERLPALLLDAQEGGSPLTLALLDLDHFKQINDTRSHHAGDQVLHQVARLIEDAAAEVPDGAAVRMGGEEFLLILPGIGATAAARRLEGVRRAVAGHAWDEITGGLPVTISVGFVTAPADGAERGVLLAAADAHLYEAKRAGRDRVVGGRPGPAEAVARLVGPREAEGGTARSEPAGS